MALIVHGVLKNGDHYRVWEATSSPGVINLFLRRGGEGVLVALEREHVLAAAAALEILEDRLDVVAPFSTARADFNPVLGGAK